MAVRSHFHVALQGTAASRPAAPAKDLLYYATDTGQLSIYDTGGAAWTNVGFAGLSDPVAIGDGGTGQTAKTAAFDALSPLSTLGDLILHDGTNNIRLAKGANYSHLVTDTAETNDVAWRTHTHLVPLLAAGATTNFTTGAAYATVFGAGGRSPTRFKADLSCYKQARIHVYGGISAITVDAFVKIVDVSSGGGPYDITPALYINAVGPQAWTGAWTAMNAASYAGDTEFEAQAIQGTAADVIRFDSLAVEFR